jgi:drug/metabolite transporter (DMT)-like permease
MRSQFEAFAFCLLGVLGFSFTIPATRIAGRELHPLLLGPGRGALSGLLALAILKFRRERVPSARELDSLAIVALGVVLGFPLCTSLALRHVPAFHAVVFIGITPLATSVVASIRNGERPSPLFWSCATAGAISVVAFGLAGGNDLSFVHADGLLCLAVLGAALGYTEGGRLARTRDGLSVTCWALALALPVTLFAAYVGSQASSPPSLPSLLGFVWVSLISSLLAFAAYYRGLASSGVARGSQVQLVQPVLSLGWCALLLGEHVSPASVVASTAVLISAAASRVFRVAPGNPER